MAIWPFGKSKKPATPPARIGGTRVSSSPSSSSSSYRSETDSFWATTSLLSGSGSSDSWSSSDSGSSDSCGSSDSGSCDSGSCGCD